MADITFGAVTPARFRDDYPEFAAVGDYPPSGINYLINMASLLFTYRWDTTAGAGGLSMRDVAVELFIAHNLAIEKLAIDAAANRAVPGISTGPIAGQSVGPVSINYATSEAMEPGAGHWNLTTYGLRLKNLFNMFGAGPIQVNIGETPWFAVGAWAGPLPWPLPSGTGFSS